MDTNTNVIVFDPMKSFSRIINLKGRIAPIAEKAWRNYTHKSKQTDELGSLFYFAVGHAFKNIDKTGLFDLAYDPSIDKYTPNRFKHVYGKDSFLFFVKEVQDNNIICHIRNLNSHYVHDFSKMNVSEYPGLETFLIESFEIAAIMSYVKLERWSLEEYYDKEKKDKQLLVKFLKDCFLTGTGQKSNYDKSDEYDKIRDDFSKLSKNKAIDALLFIDNDSTIEWTLDYNHKVFDIDKGKYLSLNAQLFLLSMFLYKGEAETLISKVKGFKRNDCEKFKSKRNIFTFFSKKFTSQDIDSEASNLIKFRDIIQYLNHYPTAWNKWLEMETNKSETTKAFEEKIIDFEINRLFKNEDNGLFPDKLSNDKFRIYAKYQIWGKRYFGKDIERKYIDSEFSDTEIDKFEYRVYTSPELMNAYAKREELKKKGKTDEKNLEIIAKLEKQENPILTKLKKRIEENMLFTSYGRNQDRFMQFACRFLAESSYFGGEAQFKMYQYYTIDEQEKAAEDFTKQELDKLKYHQGKVVYFSTFKNHLSRYNSWDTPFVIENNAIQIKLEAGQYISIQRALIPYLLEHALYNDSKFKNGEPLFNDYLEYLSKEKASGVECLRGNDEITIEKKSELSKILPKRLLHGYSPAQLSDEEAVNSLRAILDDTNRAEERYNKLHEQAIKLDQQIKRSNKDGNVTLLEDFEKKNKGKNFKLRFIKKAWNLMYFKDIYNARKELYRQSESINKHHEHEKGHHKGLHITKSEYLDFCRYMFALGEVKEYRCKLKSMLQEKRFFENRDFDSLFNSCANLDDMYVETKKAFATWLQSQTPRRGSFALENYQHIANPTQHILYINLSHFIKYIGKNWAQDKDHNTVVFRALENKEYLINEYYCKDKSGNSPFYKKNKDVKKFYNELNHQYLEDCLLYEISMRYLKQDGEITTTIASPVNEILNKDIKFEIKNSTGKLLYHLSVPFNKLDSYVGLIEYKKTQEKEQKNKGTSFLSNLDNYLTNINGELKKLIPDYYKQKNMKYEYIQKIDSYLINQSSIFTEVSLCLEKYFISKYKIEITVGNRIEFSEIGDIQSKNGKDHIKNYIKEMDRNKAFHFGLPDGAYMNKLKKIESEFIKNEIKIKSKDYSLMNPLHKAICTVFLNSIHGDFFDKMEKSIIKRRFDAESKYFTDIISTNII